MLDRASIDPDADRVVRRLARHGHKTYLVGGCVRDLLLERKPKDFDVATSATPNEIKQLFRNCRIIGRRFRLAHIFFGDKIIETSTFRANPREGDGDGDGELLIKRDNVFGSETDDARRRDFTINGLFYDVEKEEVIDHVGGLADLEARLMRTIGDPEVRFQEDPIRILRAIKFAARIGFTIEPATYRALVRWRHEISKCAAPRVLEEVYRLLRGGAARRSMELLVETGTLEVLSPQLASLLEGAGAPASPNPLLAASEPGARLVRALPSDADDAGDDDEDDEDDVGDEDDVVDGAPAALARDLDEEEAAWHRVWAEEVIPALGERPQLRLSFVRDAVDLERRRRAAWQLLDQLDAMVHAGRDPSNVLALCVPIAPFVVDAVIAPGSRPGDANNAILEVGQPIVDQLRVARRDAERMRNVLLAQRRIVPARRRRLNVEGMGGREVLEDGVMLYELMERAGGRAVADDAAALPAGADEDVDAEVEGDEELDELG
ncbi:MAG: polynucleotide adenylyltransferase PcnB, partial [Myxococcales bacterium]|nr:polynucleotide adenylyltransferase PcnB [Myxococcales bacterium]